MFGVTLGQRLDRQPQQGARQAQRLEVGGLVLQPPGAQRASGVLLAAQGLVRILLAFDGAAAGDDLGSDLLDLGNGSADCARLGLALAGALDLLVEAAAQRQQQR